MVLWAEMLRGTASVLLTRDRWIGKLRARMRFFFYEKKPRYTPICEENLLFPPGSINNQTIDIRAIVIGAQETYVARDPTGRLYPIRSNINRENTVEKSKESYKFSRSLKITKNLFSDTNIVCDICATEYSLARRRICIRFVLKCIR